MRKQELKSRRKVHSHKRKKKRSHTPTAKKEIPIVEYRPEVFTLEK